MLIKIYIKKTVLPLIRLQLHLINPLELIR